MSTIITKEEVAQVVSVLPNKIKIQVTDIEAFKENTESFSVGSYLRVSDSQDCALICIIENFTIEKNEEKKSQYILEAVPIGFLDSDKKFIRGGNNIAIPPTGVQPAKKEEIQSIYNAIEDKKMFCFSSLAQDTSIKIPVNGDKFFNKHIAVVGSTGSGKSHTVAKIIQEVTVVKEGKYEGLNNSHIIIFDIHSEYKQAFPDANYIDVDSLVLPYWLMNGEELEELLVESGENQAYNQTSLLRRLITRNKQIKSESEKVMFDTPVQFSIDEVANCIVNLSKETRNAKNPKSMCIKEGEKEFSNDEEKFDLYFEKEFDFEETKAQSINKGTYNDGTLEKFISRLKSKLTDKRLDFLLGEKVNGVSFEDTLIHLLGHRENENANVTIIDLSGVPFEVLSITVSLISRLMFEYGYYYKKHMEVTKKSHTPLLLVYEEAHKYVPKNQAAKFNSSRISIERIAKEGRKYGVTAMIVSQRPSEISESIFSQCNNFVSMRLTNPDDQNYVRRLLPDNLGPLTESLPTLREGEAIIIGDAIIMPSLVLMERCSPEPSSNDIDYLQEWKKQWLEVDFDKISERWKK
ncbi:anti-phage-associated helicase HerA [Paenibacillus selenitireducens]|uniref:anti-phage-associated helicase HerA n=1 Tax=Paenibacillus selenitireducens TaxID=1324314 RepID=UPI001E4B5E37|nr:anti-phage-associated helicase HerA [Paenibacillus selenitireducens]